jgi:alkylated DNA repair protein alkB family protein 4
MDDPVPMPPFLARRPSESGSEARDSSIHFYDPLSRSASTSPEFSGLLLYRDFLSQSEAVRLLEVLETTPFVAAQSGKGKQHYGPKINFNKRKINASGFLGIPEYARDLEARMRRRVRDDHSLSRQERTAVDYALDAFETTDVFVLRYRPEESSNLDFHLDDPLAYGELILDLSLESDAILTFVRGRPNSELGERSSQADPPACIRVPLPARSLAVLYGPARFDWEHAILAYDIEAQRTSVTLRTLGDTFRTTEEGQTVLERARSQPTGREPD